MSKLNAVFSMIVLCAAVFVSGRSSGDSFDPVRHFCNPSGLIFTYDSSALWLNYIRELRTGTVNPPNDCASGHYFDLIQYLSGSRSYEIIDQNVSLMVASLSTHVSQEALTSGLVEIYAFVSLSCGNIDCFNDTLRRNRVFSLINQIDLQCGSVQWANREIFSEIESALIGFSDICYTKERNSIDASSIYVNLQRVLDGDI